MQRTLSTGFVLCLVATAISVPEPAFESGVAIAAVGQQCAGPPNAPAGLIANVTGALVTLTWRPSDGCATHFVVHAGSAPGLSNVAVANVGGSFTLSASAPAGTYYVRVIAQNDAGSSGPSSEVVVTVGGGGPVPPPIPCAGPPAPPQLSATVSESLGTVRITFLPLSTLTPDQTFVLEAGNVAGASNLAVVDVGRTLLFSTSLPPPGTYYVRARARDACGTGAPSNEVTLTVGAMVPPPPTPPPPTGPPTPRACGPEVPRQAACGTVVAVCERSAPPGSASSLYDGRLACGVVRDPCFATFSPVICYVCPGPFCR